MNKMKRVFAALLAVAMMSAFAACTTNNLPSGPVDNGNTPATTPSETPATPSTPAQTTPSESAKPEENKPAEGTQTGAEGTAVISEEDAFTPSVSQKGAPANVTIETVDGKNVIAIVRTPNLDVELRLYEGDLTVTPLSGREAASEETKAELEGAYKLLTDPDYQEQALPKLAEALKAMNSTLTVNDIIVRDMFHVELNEEALELLKKDGETITTIFDFENVKKGDFVLFMRYVDGQWIINDGSWEVNGNAYVEILEDGHISLSFEDDMGVVAFIVAKAK